MQADFSYSKPHQSGEVDSTKSSLSTEKKAKQTLKGRKVAKIAKNTRLESVPFQKNPAENKSSASTAVNMPLRPHADKKGMRSLFDRVIGVLRGKPDTQIPLSPKAEGSDLSTFEKDKSTVYELERLFQKIESQMTSLENFVSDRSRSGIPPEKLEEMPAYKGLEDKIVQNLNKLCDLLNVINGLPHNQKSDILRLLEKQFVGSGNVFFYAKIENSLSSLEAQVAVPIKMLIADLKSLNISKIDGEVKTHLTVEEFPRASGTVTILCPLMVDGMGDLGIAMNAFDSLKDRLPDAEIKLVVLVAEDNPLGPSQLETVRKMIGGQKDIEIILGKFSPNTGSVGDLKDPGQLDKMKEILKSTNLLLNLPVDYKDGLQKMKMMMPQESRIIVSQEYGLRMKSEVQSGAVEDRRVETGPALSVYLNEGKLSVGQVFEILQSDKDVLSILPFENEAADDAEDAVRKYTEKNNLALFYLNPETPLKSIRLFLEQYLDIHVDDSRNLNIIGNIPEEILKDKKFIRSLKKDFGINKIVVLAKGEKAREIALAKPEKGKEPKVLKIYKGYRFDKKTFRALSELTLLSAKNFPNLMFAAGDGSFSDALSLMVNYSLEPLNPDFAVSLPVYITRLSFHKQTVKELIELCDHINEPILKDVFSMFQNIETLSPQERRELTLLLKSNAMKVGLARLARFISESHNLSREVSEYVTSELVRSSSKKQKREAA